MKLSDYLLQAENEPTHLTGALLIISNALPVFGVLVWDWDVASIVMLYWAENLIIGAITLCKILLTANIGSLFTAVFFLFHYGGFCAVHGILAAELLDLPVTDPMGNLDWPFFFVFVERLINIVQQVFSVASSAWLWSFAAIAASHGISFIYHRLLRREDAEKSARALMGQPYGRIIIMHVTVLAGAFAITQVGAPIILLVILVVIKTALDFRAHRAAHRGAE